MSALTHCEVICVILLQEAERFCYCISHTHYGRKQPRIQSEVLGHSLVRLLVCSHHSLVRLLWTTRFARAFCCAHSFAHFAHSLARGKMMSQNDLILSHSAPYFQALDLLTHYRIINILFIQANAWTVETPLSITTMLAQSSFSP